LDYDSCFSLSLYINVEDDNYLSSLPSGESEKILADCFAVLKEITDNSNKLKLLHSKYIVEDQSTVVAAKIFGTTRRHVITATKSRKIAKAKRHTSIQEPAALKVQDGWEVLDNDCQTNTMTNKCLEIISIIIQNN
jgi:hypothetical protein